MVPWLGAARRLPAEDAVVLQAEAPVARKSLKVAALLLPHIANFDDFDPLRSDPNVAFMYVTPGMAVPGDVELLIIPGTKTTLGDLAFLRHQGWDVDIAAHLRRGGRLLGICGGMQMLGKRIADPDGIEGTPAEAAGLGYLNIDTLLTDNKILRPVTGRLSNGGAPFQGYEMHVGRTTGPALSRPFAALDGARDDGAISGDGKIIGTYVHGLLQSGAARAAILGVGTRARDHQFAVDAILDEIAASLEQSLDIPALAALAGLRLP
jgi:adenosylcobyric acid synthase